MYSKYSNYFMYFFFISGEKMSTLKEVKPWRINIGIGELWNLLFLNWGLCRSGKNILTDIFKYSRNFKMWRCISTQDDFYVYENLSIWNSGFATCWFTTFMFSYKMQNTQNTYNIHIIQICIWPKKRVEKWFRIFFNFSCGPKIRSSGIICRAIFLN